MGKSSPQLKGCDLIMILRTYFNTSNRKF